MVKYVRKTQYLWTANDIQMATNFSGRKVLNDMLRNCSECFVPALQDGCSVVLDSTLKSEEEQSLFYKDQNA